MVNYQHEFLVKSPSVCTSSVLSVILPICTSSAPSINPSDVKCQEIPEEFPAIDNGEKFQVEIMAKFPDNIP